MSLISALIDYGIIGIMALLSLWSFAVGFERLGFYRRVQLQGYATANALETALTRRLVVIGTIAANTPYIGLLGTVLGIMLTFYNMGHGAGLDVKTIMVGLSLALKSTAVGLLVAIPCVALNNVLRRRVRELLSAYADLDAQAGQAHGA